MKLFVNRKPTSSIEFLYKVASIFGLVSPFNFKENKSAHKRYHTILYIIMIFTFIIAYIVSTGEQVKSVFLISNPVELLVEALGEFFEVLLVIATISVSIKKRNCWARMTKLLNKIQNYSKKRPATQLENISNNMSCFIVILILLYNQCNFIIVWGLKDVLPHILFYVTIYLSFLVSMVISRLSTNIKHYFEDVNSFNPKNIESATGSEFYYFYKKIIILLKIVDLFNEIFAWPITIFSGTALLRALRYCGFFLYNKELKYSFDTYVAYCIYEMTFLVKISQEHNDFNYYIYFLFQILGIFLILNCNQTNQEIHKTSYICFKILLESDENDINTNKILHFAMRTSRCCPQICLIDSSAVNINMMLKFIGVLITYTIVLIQFQTEFRSVEKDQLK